MKKSFMLNNLSNSAQKQGATTERAFKDFSLPKNVTNYLDKQDNYRSSLENHIDHEKQKISVFILSLKEDLLFNIDQKHSELNKVFDDYLNIFNTNSQMLNDTVLNFKDTKSLFDVHSMGNQANRLLKIEGIEYFEKKPSGLFKFKEEKSDATYKFSEIKRELDKKVLSYYTKEIEKQVSHYPLFCQSESSEQFLSEMKVDVTRMLIDNLNILDEMVYTQSHTDFSNIIV